jgi:hypothetical protein
MNDFHPEKLYKTKKVKKITKKWRKRKNNLPHNQCTNACILGANWDHQDFFKNP